MSRNFSKQLITKLRNIPEERRPQLQRGGSLKSRIPITWPLRSPELTPLYFFLWGCRKNALYVLICRPLCRNLLGAYELLQLQLLVRWSQVYGLNLNRDVRLLTLPITKNLWTVEYGSQETLDYITYQNTFSFLSCFSYFLSSITLNHAHFMCSSFAFLRHTDY